MARIKAGELPRPGKETQKEQLLREGRIAIRRDMERRFHSRTPAWRAMHEALASGAREERPGDQGPQECVSVQSVQI